MAIKKAESVSDFYSGKTIFITGATGYVGKVLLEKLLCACPDIKKVYILVRAKRGVHPQERVAKLLNDPIFTKYQRVSLMNLAKIEAIAGDICEPNLGINEFDRRKLVKEVDLVFHSAATVKFDEPLPVALKINFCGTKSMLALCKSMEKLQVYETVKHCCRLPVIISF